MEPIKRPPGLHVRLEPKGLAAAVETGDRRSLAKAITLVENEPRAAGELLRALRPKGGAFVLGVTGPPGAGKSSLVDRLVKGYRAKGLKVAVVAVDPTSPVTGGALLGDRIRMTDLGGDPGVFIRSMASRGWTGGLARATSRVVQLMDSAGYDVVIVETVGIGQSDIEVVGIAHAVLVVLMPGLGDDVQVSKAGLMEVGDVYVVNKADLGGADAMVVTLLSMVRTLKGRSPAVVKVSALKGEGIEKLIAAIELLRSSFEASDSLRLRSAKGMLLQTAQAMAVERLTSDWDSRAEALSRMVVGGTLSVEAAAERLATSSLSAHTSARRGRRSPRRA